MSMPWKPDPISVFLWLTVIFVAVAIYVWWVNVLLTVFLVICASLFLGLLTFALISASADDQAEEDRNEARAEPPVTGTVPETDAN
jgi:hypothetical protein